MDRVTENLIVDYCKAYEIRSAGLDKDFEKFCSYSILSKEYPETFEIDDVCVGESPSIDGVAILVNGRLVEDIEEIEDLLKLNNTLEARFIFVQAKTTSSFDGADITNFGFGVKDCFVEKPNLSHNDVVKKKIAMISKIYEHSASMTRGLPECKLYFVTTGQWNDDANLKARIEAIKADLFNLKLFSKVYVEPLGAREIQDLYYESKRELSVEITFVNKMLMPQTMGGIIEAHIGILPFSEYSKLIIDDADNIRPVFYDNVRAFQGENDVNRDIQTTIRSEQSERFAVLNNGITIVAKSITVAQHKVTLRNYQVVNGCQTSHVIYNNRHEQAMASLWIPIKLIVTTEETITNEIIKATNNQTPVKPEELAALSQFQKDLEEFYASFQGDSRLYYERRSKQYANDTAVNKSKIITIPIQIKVFAAMFLEVPHKVGRYYGTIIREIGDDIFSLDHKLIPYYASALAFYKLESFFRTGQIDPKYKKCRFFLLFALKGICCGFAAKLFNSREFEDDCDKLLKILNDNQQCLETFLKACSYMDQLNLDYNERDNFKKQTTTLSLKERITR